MRNLKIYNKLLELYPEAFPKMPFVLSTKECQACKLAKMMLLKGDVFFHSLDIDDVKGLREDSVEDGFKSLPIVWNGEEFSTGFNIEVLNKMVKARRAEIQKEE